MKSENEKILSEFESVYFPAEKKIEIAALRVLSSVDSEAIDRKIAEKEIKLAISRFNRDIFDALESYLKNSERED